MNDLTISLIAVFVGCVVSFLTYYRLYYSKTKRTFRRARRVIRRNTKNIRKAVRSLNEVRKALRDIERSTDMLKDGCGRLDDCGVLIHKGNADPWTGEFEYCDVCGNILLRDEHGELRCFECNPPQDAPQFEVGDAVRFKCDGKRATITDVKDDHIEVQDDDGNISACHTYDIEKA